MPYAKGLSNAFSLEEITNDCPLDYLLLCAIAALGINLMPWNLVKNIKNILGKIDHKEAAIMEANAFLLDLPIHS